MPVHQKTLEIRSSGRGFVDLTRRSAGSLRKRRAHGPVHGLRAAHFSQPGDPGERRSRGAARPGRWFAEIAPESRRWEHDDEGPDDMPAHARSALTRTSEVVPITRAGSRSGPGRRSISGSTARARTRGGWSCTSRGALNALRRHAILRHRRDRFHRPAPVPRARGARPPVVAMVRSPAKLGFAARKHASFPRLTWLPSPIPAPCSRLGLVVHLAGIVAADKLEDYEAVNFGASRTCSIAWSARAGGHVACCSPPRSLRPALRRPTRPGRNAIRWRRSSPTVRPKPAPKRWFYELLFRRPASGRRWCSDRRIRRP